MIKMENDIAKTDSTGPPKESINRMLIFLEKLMNDYKNGIRAAILGNIIDISKFIFLKIGVAFITRVVLCPFFLVQSHGSYFSGSLSGQKKKIQKIRRFFGKAPRQKNSS